MSDLDLLYLLDQDPDAYWIIHDLCLLNNWCPIYSNNIDPSWDIHNGNSKVGSICRSSIRYWWYSSIIGNYYASKH
jgi:hypothetical protein